MRLKNAMWASAFGLLFAVRPAVAQAQDFVVVVGASSSVSSLTKRELSDIFLKKARKVGETTLAPVDQPTTSKLREAFSKAIHGHTSAFIQTYWQTQIFAGKEIPPVVKGSDVDVLAFVRANGGAIGYVAADTPLGDAVKAVTIKGP